MIASSFGRWTNCNLHRFHRVLLIVISAFGRPPRDSVFKGANAGLAAGRIYSFFTLGERETRTGAKKNLRLRQRGHQACQKVRENETKTKTLWARNANKPGRGSFLSLWYKYFIRSGEAALYVFTFFESGSLCVFKTSRN